MEPALLGVWPVRTILSSTGVGRAGVPAWGSPSCTCDVRNSSSFLRAFRVASNAMSVWDIYRICSATCAGITSSWTIPCSMNATSYGKSICIRARTVDSETSPPYRWCRICSRAALMTSAGADSTGILHPIGALPDRINAARSSPPSCRIALTTSSVLGFPDPSSAPASRNLAKTCLCAAC